MRVFPLRKRYVAFSIPNREKIEGSILYRPKSSRGSYSRIEEIWILSRGKECVLDIEPGAHCWIDDSFELEPTNLDLWIEYCDKPEFKSLLEVQQKYGGEVKTSLVLEDSILVIDPEYQGSTVQKLGQWQ